ncbi:capZ-interacting protein-like isoform X2 [Stegostoma tigrinum]|uniref:capZ-interacting protein-like isoform X2 n=1 Tax=Stegostoma tigrinum TaxID=3053191 RepID=UPI00202B67F3|nr:capZ-interacting protein-like isoform X2 [Stegostoma tigrinum]
MEESSGDAIPTMEEKPLSVAALASKFKQETNNTLEKNEKPPKRPVRKKPPSSLPLCGMKNDIEADHHADEKSSVNDSNRQPKLKLKTSSPLIEKLQANLLLSPTALLPGAGPKSPLKSSFSPFASPASTPDSPGARSQSSESDGGPVTVDQPAERGPLHSLHKNRVRVSVKRRPPSRKFRRSVTEDAANSDSPETDAPPMNAEPAQNGTPDEESNDVFTDQGVQTEDTTSKSSPSPEEDSLPSPKESSPEQASEKELNRLSSSQSQESEISSDLSQCEYLEANDITTKENEESSNKDSVASVSSDHNIAGSETADSETSKEEPKIDEVKANDIQQQNSKAEENSPAVTED